MLLLLLLACPKPELEPDDVADPLRWVRSRAGTPIAADDVDWAFQDALATLYGGEPPARETELLTTLLTPPEVCIPVWTMSGGQEMVAVQPPFEDQPPEQIAATEIAIRGLLDGVEVSLACSEPVPCDVPCEQIAVDRPVFAVNVHRSPEGWRFRAWRDFADQPAH